MGICWKNDFKPEFFQYTNRTSFPDVYTYQEKYPAAKPLKSIGYDLLIDDTHSLAAAQENGFQLIRVDQFAPEYGRLEPFPSDLFTTVINRASKTKK